MPLLVCPNDNASMQSVQEPQPSRTGAGAASTSGASVMTAPSATNDPRPGAIAIVFLPANVRPAACEPARSTCMLWSTNTAARVPVRMIASVGTSSDGFAAPGEKTTSAVMPGTSRCSGLLT